MDRPAEKDITLFVTASTSIEVYWCFPGPERKVGHWYARVCYGDGRNTQGRKVESREHGIRWARGIAKAAA